MVYGLPQAFGLRNDEGAKDGEFFYFSISALNTSSCGLLRFARNDSTPTLSLRGFEKAVAISVWYTVAHLTNHHCESRYLHTVIARTEGSWQSQYEV